MPVERDWPSGYQLLIVAQNSDIFRMNPISIQLITNQVSIYITEYDFLLRNWGKSPK